MKEFEAETRIDRGDYPIVRVYKIQKNWFAQLGNGDVKKLVRGVSGRGFWRGFGRWQAVNVRELAKKQANAAEGPVTFVDKSAPKD